MNVEWPPGLNISPEPVRRVITRSAQTSNGWFSSRKVPNRRDISLAAESPIERDFLILAELDPNVQAIAAQPCRLNCEVHGQPYRAVPDFALLVNGRGEIHEVKSDRAYASPKTIDRARSVARSVEACGWTFSVALGSEIRQPPIFGRAQALWRRWRTTYTKRHALAVPGALLAGPRRIADIVSHLRSQFGDEAPTVEQVLSLAACGRVFIDLSADVGPDSLVRIADPAEMPPTLLPYRHPSEGQPGRQAA